jgi:glutamate-5-semialdehyde dehydrogenase
MDDARSLVEREAAASRAALPALRDDAVADALGRAAALLRERATRVLEANAADVSAATASLDEGALDRLRLDGARVEALAAQLETMAALPPLEREGAAWTLPNGLQVAERRIPIGVCGATFEARPGVALDVAAQLLKSLNAGVLRTGGAALATVTVLVDEVLRPALEEAGLPPAAIGLVRAAGHDGAYALCSLPALVPLVIVRGSGETTAALARHGAAHGVRVLAHAEGGGVLYVHASADERKLRALVAASLDRLGVCNRLNLALVDRGAAALHAALVEECERAGVTPLDSGALDVRLGHEWANDPERVATVTVHLVGGLDDALAVANDATSGLAAGIVAEDADAAQRFLDGYRGTAAYWHATTRFTDGFALTGAPETGINVDWTPGPRGPVTYRDLWLRQYRVVGDGTQAR